MATEGHCKAFMHRASRRSKAGSATKKQTSICMLNFHLKNLRIQGCPGSTYQESAAMLFASPCAYTRHTFCHLVCKAVLSTAFMGVAENRKVRFKQPGLL